MSKDLRELLENQQNETSELSRNHRANFELKLQKELHSKKTNSKIFLKIAAAILVLVGLVSSLFYFSKSEEITPLKVVKVESLGSISPELKKVETFYLASIQTEISNLEENPENKDLLDGYLEKIGELTEEYKLLTIELNNEGLNEKTVNALIENLQLRLNLLYQLKTQLNNLKNLNTQENEDLQV